MENGRSLANLPRPRHSSFSACKNGPALHYLIALGSNQPHGRFGRPQQVIDAALRQLDLRLVSRSPIIHSEPIGPSHRRYANAVAIVESAMNPPELLAHLKAIERAFGRTRGGQRWSARVLDLDIILWSGGIWTSPGLGVPHREFRNRFFVLGPACMIAPDWRDPLTGLKLRHLKARLDRNRPHP